jgi:hypothetical protein
MLGTLSSRYPIVNCPVIHISAAGTHVAAAVVAKPEDEVLVTNAQTLSLSLSPAEFAIV